jgi:uncharacterized protein YndB with AHSA1/START domain
MTGPKFERTVFLGVPAAAAWKALVDPEIVREYYMVPLQTLELKPGGAITYGVGEQAFISGEVVEVVPEERLVHTFAFEGETHPGVEPDPPSRVSYELAAMGDMCKLHLVHDGFEEDSQTCANVTGGWDVILSSLKTLLETGEPLPWPRGGCD